jgi:hypothetical protein
VPTAHLEDAQRRRRQVLEHIRREVHAA